MRYTWEQDDKGHPVPHGWYTPPGKDMVRVRKMEWDSSRKAYTFTTEENPRITIIWTPDSSDVNIPSNTGNQYPVRIPNGMPDKGHSYHPAPETEEITGIADLIEVKGRTPKQGGVGTSNVICEVDMSYKIRLQWFNKQTFEGEGKEYSDVLDSSIYFLDKIGLSDEPKIYDGVYDVVVEWLPYIQPYFQHQLIFQKYDYQLAFRPV